MTPAEQARLLAQATRNITLEDIGKMATRANVKTVVLSHLSARADGSDDYTSWVDLCALVGALVIDGDGAYDPRLVNDRLLLGLKGTMSEYELSLLRQRGLAARDSKAKRGELRFALPPGYCGNELGQIDITWIRMSGLPSRYGWYSENSANWGAPGRCCCGC